MGFIGFTQCALLCSVPLLIARTDSRRDFAAILLNVRNLPKLAAVFLVGVSGLALFDVGLSSAHPTNRGNIELDSILGRFGCVRRLKEIGLGLARRVFRLLSRGVLRGDDDCLEPDQR
jgi:hypothetical protein